MNCKTHLLGATTFTLGYYMLINKNVSLIEPSNAICFGCLMAASCLGAKLPDIDTKTSTISHKNRIISFFLRIFTEHRGITHTPFLLSIFCFYLNSFATRINQLWINSIVVGFTIGYISHLAYDMLNPRGIPLLYPVIKKKFHLAKITTGSFNERLFYIVNITLFLFMCFRLINAHIYNIDFLLKKLWFSELFFFVGRLN